MSMILWLLALGVGAQEDFIPFRKGIRWVYKQGDTEFVQTVTKIEKVGGTECFVLESGLSGSAERMWVAVSGEGVFLHQVDSGGSPLTLSKPALMLKYPLKKGDRWEALVPSGETNLEYQFENAGPESVEVPAGKFEAWKIQGKGIASGREFSVTYWYAKGVGKVKQVTSAGKGELRLELKEVK